MATPTIKKFRSVILGLLSQPSNNNNNKNSQGFNKEQGNTYVPTTISPNTSKVKDSGNESRTTSVDNSDIFWKTSEEGDFVYSHQFEKPFLALIESSITSRNLGRCDPIAIGKLIAEFIDGERTITISGRNQIKVFCDNRNHANILLTSQNLRERGFITFVPESLIYKKGFIRVLAKYPITEIIENLDKNSRDLLGMAKRRMHGGGELEKKI